METLFQSLFYFSLQSKQPKQIVIIIFYRHDRVDKSMLEAYCLVASPYNWNYCLNWNSNVRLSLEMRAC